MRPRCRPVAGRRLLRLHLPLPHPERDVRRQVPLLRDREDHEEAAGGRTEEVRAVHQRGLPRGDDTPKSMSSSTWTRSTTTSTSTSRQWTTTSCAFGYDPYNAKGFVSRWESENGPFGIEKVIQGSKTESVPLGSSRGLSEERKAPLRRGDHEVRHGELRRHRGHQRIPGSSGSKGTRRRIDPVAAMMDCLRRLQAEPGFVRIGGDRVWKQTSCATTA